MFYKRLSALLAVLLLVAVLVPIARYVSAQGEDSQTDPNDTETEARNKALTYQLYEETNAGNSQFFFDLLAEDYVDHNFEGGRDAFIALYDGFMSAFPDLQFEVTHLLADGDLVAVRGVQTATHEGNFMGIAPATGNEVAWTGTAIFRFNDEGKIVERWQNLDEYGLMIQLGVLPMPGTDTSG